MSSSQLAREPSTGTARGPARSRLMRVLRLSAREESALLSTVFAGSPDGMAFLDPNLVIRAANETFARQVRVPLSQLPGSTAEDVIRGWSEQMSHIYDEIRTTGEPFHSDALPFVFRGQPERGLTYWDISISPVYGTDGVLLGYLRLSREVTERKSAEKEHRRLQRDLHEAASEAQRRTSEIAAVIDSIADAVFVADKQGRIVDVNEAGLRLVGVSTKEEALKAEFDYLSILDLRHPDGQPLSPGEMVLSRALQGDVVRGYEELARDVTTNRPLYLLVSGGPLRDRDGQISGAVAVMSDITSMRELDRLKDQFITVAAHELKTPIAIMKGYAQGLLRIAAKMPSSERRMLEAINRGSDRIESIVEDLLDISRLHLDRLDLTTASVDLAELAHEVADRVDLTSQRHRVRLTKGEPVVVFADRYRLDQVLTNLIDNAMRYSPAGGDIDIEVTTSDSEAMVSVRDYGVGIPSGKQQHIFERFYRAHTGTPFDYGGMGVGLYICREIVSRHGGRMWFESEEGKGSTFHFSLPLPE